MAKIKLEDVAQLANVSPATASLALAGKTVVKEETRKRVVHAAEKLGYVGSSIAASLKSGKTNTIALFIINQQQNKSLTESTSYFWEILRGILDVTDEYGYSFSYHVFYWEDPKSMQYLNHRINNSSVDGYIIFPNYMYHYSFLNELVGTEKPFVICNPVVNVEPENTVIIDNYTGGVKATEHLLERGYRKLALINGPENHFDAVNRLRGFRDVLSQNDEHIISEYIMCSDFTINGGYHDTKQFLPGLSDYPDAIFYTNDHMASGGIRAIHELGLKIPDDIGVIGYDGLAIGEAVSPLLTTIDTNTYCVGVTTAKRLFSLINGEEHNKPAILEPQLVVRDST